MDRKKIYNEIQKIVESSESILITSHSSPDGDSVGSQLGMYNYILTLGKQATIINQGTISFQYDFLPGNRKIINSGDYSPTGVFDLAVILDCSNLDRIGQVAQFIGSKTKIINMDHHPDNNGFGDIVLLNNQASSTAEILTELFLELNLSIDKDTATVLYSAIMTDTGRFRFESTGQRTMELVGVLIGCGAQPRKICDAVYYSQSPDMLRLTGEMLSKAEFYEDGKICMMEISSQNLLKHGCSIEDLDGLAEYTLSTQKAIIGALFKQLSDGSTKVSLRSKDAINVSEVAHKYGGGGHRNASGYVTSLTPKDGKLDLIGNLKGLLN